MKVNIMIRIKGHVSHYFGKYTMQCQTQQPLYF